MHGPDAEERHITDKNVVFAFQVFSFFFSYHFVNCTMPLMLQLPIPRGGLELDYSRWMQNLIGILQIDVTFYKGNIHIVCQSDLNNIGMLYRVGANGA